MAGRRKQSDGGVEDSDVRGAARPDPERETLLGAAEFEFDLAGPFMDQVFARLGIVQPIALTEENVSTIKPSPGVYVLYQDDQAVYVGKADDSVLVRLRKHLRTLTGCQNIDLSKMKFKCLYVAATWSPLNYEQEVINRLGTRRGPGWNNKGFGSNDPGVNRGKTRLKSSHFYRRFPIKKDWRCNGVRAGSRSAFELLEEVKRNVPFWFKFQGYRIREDAEEGDIRTQEQARKELQETMVEVPQDNMLASELLLLVAKNLPGIWQATITASHMLLYKEQNQVYPIMEVIWPR